MMLEYDNRKNAPPVRQCIYCGADIFAEWNWGTDIDVGVWRYVQHNVQWCLERLNARIKALEKERS